MLNDPYPQDRFKGFASYADALAAYQAEPPVHVLFDNGAGTGNTSGVPAGLPAPAFIYDSPSWLISGTSATTWFLGPNGSGVEPAPALELDACRRREVAVVHHRAVDQRHVMIGPGSANLWVRSSAVDTDLQVTLSEVRPDGNETYIQNGWMRASMRALDPELSPKLNPVQSMLATDATKLRGAARHTDQRHRPLGRAALGLRCAGDRGGGDLHSVAPCPSLRGQPCRPYVTPAAQP